MKKLHFLAYYAAIKEWMELQGVDWSRSKKLLLPTTDRLCMLEAIEADFRELS